jgi:KEOPS complex subunit Pcc1
MEVESEFVFEMSNTIDVIYQSLLPELGASHQRTSSQLTIQGSELILKISSYDLVSMRAALNGWLRLIKIAVDMSMAIEK